MYDKYDLVVVMYSMTIKLHIFYGSKKTQCLPSSTKGGEIM